MIVFTDNVISGQMGPLHIMIAIITTFYHNNLSGINQHSDCSFVKMTIHPIDDKTLDQAAACLKSGGLVAFPTETVYGLGALATNATAVARIFSAKQRPKFNPLISHFHSVEAALAAGLHSKASAKLAAAFWPGPLTLILNRPDNSPIASLASAGTDTLAVRVPSHPVARELLARVNAPVVAPSANPSGRISPSTARHVAAGLGSACDMILDGGACESGIESTVIDCRTDIPVLLRPGPLTTEEIINRTGIDLGVHGPQKQPDKPVAPGQIESHYAPEATVRLNATDKQKDEVYIGFGPAGPDLIPDFNLSEAADLVEAAANLFAVLHDADTLGTRTIAIAPIPMAGLGIAINDRISRAAAPRPDPAE